MTEVRTPVAIVGGGPCGLATALALARHGVASTVVERFPSTNPHPRAHVVNTRSMELLRRWGLEDQVRADAIDPLWLLAIRWTTTLAGEELGAVDMANLPEERILARLGASPTGTVSCAQDRVQQHLFDACAAREEITIHRATAATSIALEDDGVVLGVEGDLDGTVRADYLVGADGSRSWVRDQLGIALTGMPPLAHQINVYFHADLSRWTDRRPAVLYWALNPASRGVFIAMDGKRRWTFNFEWNPAVEEASDYDEERCRERILAAIGAPEAELDIRLVGSWTMHAETARSYRRGRAFLVGDAAHRFPPTGGFGMNTGLADADNLAWKLAGVLQGWAAPSLLDTYQRERRPVALSNNQFSVHNALRMAETGIGPTAPDVIARLSSDDPAVAEAERARLRPAIEAQRPHFDALNQDLGYAYDRSPVVIPDGTPPPTPVDPACDFEPMARPGHRLPHVWLERAGETISSLDLVGPHLAVLVGPEVDGWADVDHGSGPPVQVTRLGVDVGGDVAGALAAFGIGPRGALVVRPDGHVAHRAVDVDDTAGPRLPAVVDVVVGTQHVAAT